MKSEELQTLIKDMDDYKTGHVPALLLMKRATKGLKSQQTRIEELEALVEKAFWDGFDSASDPPGTPCVWERFVERNRRYLNS